jgi:hypothetical protein
VLVLGADGKELKRFDGLDGLLPAGATPVGGPTGRDVVDWSPQANRLLVALAGGGVIDVPLDGTPALLLRPDQAPAPLDAAWSPAGDAVAFVGQPAGASGAGLYVADTTKTPVQVKAIVAAPSGIGPSVVAMAWHPNGRSLLFTRTGPSNDPRLGGDLFQVPPSGGTPRLVAAAGRAGPVSGIVDFAPSPDGRAVAFVVALPGDPLPEFHSLWVQQIGTPSALRLTVPPGTSVVNVWWTAAGLVWEAVPGTAVQPREPAAPRALTHYLSTGIETRAVYQAQPPATPVASPVGSPVASPVGSPAPSPAGSPAATPQASPSR